MLSVQGRSPSPKLYRPSPPGLPTPRPRALTLDSSSYPPSPGEMSTVLRTASQSSSLFFSRLPLEVRILVYGHLFGNRTLHIELKHCEPRVKDKGNCELDIGWLITCRQGYSEAIVVLYRTNEFQFQRHSHETIKSLSDIFLPQRLATITAVDISWAQLGPQNMIDDFGPTYTSLWDGISLMTNLRSLRIKLMLLKPVIPDPFEQTERAIEREWLGPPDELVRRLGSQLGEFIFMVPDSLYSVLQGLRDEEELPSCCDETLNCFTRIIGGYEYVINNDWPDF